MLFKVRKWYMFAYRFFIAIVLCSFVLHMQAMPAESIKNLFVLFGWCTHQTVIIPWQSDNTMQDFCARYQELTNEFRRLAREQHSNDDYEQSFCSGCLYIADCVRFGCCVLMRAGGSCERYRKILEDELIERIFYKTCTRAESMQDQLWSNQEICAIYGNRKEVNQYLSDCALQIELHEFYQ